MKRTNKYGLTYYEKGDSTTSLEEMQRWETLDVQLNSLFNILGNGVLEGWEIFASSGLNCVVTPGKGHVAFVAVESENNVSLTLTSLARNYIYAQLSSDSYWTKNLIVSASTFTSDNANVLYLGYVDTSIDSILAINTDDRAVLGFESLVRDIIKAHRHIGGTQNPSPINLSTDVKGSLSPENIPYLDASKIQTGQIDTDRLPLIDHITNLSDQGVLTHSQLDDFVNTLSLPDQTLMGEVSTINLLQLILALKHVYPDIDEFLVNELSFIPGISPDDYIDIINTTATVDTRPASEGGTHKITGMPSTGFKAYTKIWDTEDDFKTGTSARTIVNGDSVCLNTKENVLIIDDFSDINTWIIETSDLSSLPSTLVKDTSTYVIPPSSAQLQIGSKTVQLLLNIKKLFSAQDWSGYDYLRFFIKTESVEHGELYFYINDAYAGVQNSYIKVLDLNAPTINNDTLELGWQEITIDLRNFSKQNINQIGFYVSTQNGWDTSKGFSLNIDDIYLSSGNVYENDGYIRLIYGSDFLYRFFRMRWDAIIPSDSESSGVSLQVRTRVANSEAALSSSTWSIYNSTSGYLIPIPAGSMYKFIEIEFYFTASESLKRSATLRKVYLDFYAADVDNSFEYNSRADWESGYLYNIDTLSVSNSMSIYGTSEIGNIYYGTEASANQINENLQNLYRVTGALLPRSTYQVLNDLSPSLGTITGVVRGDHGNFLLSDIENDRVIELSKSGSLIKGYMGSFLTDPSDPFLSNNSASTNTASTISVLHSIYNDNDGSLYIICSSDIENIYDSKSKLNLNKIYLKIGSHRIYLDDATVELLGINKDKYEIWSPLLASSDERTSNINNFIKTSHVLKIMPQGANRSLLDNLVNQKQPTIIIYSPLEQEMTGSSVEVNFLLYNFILGNGVGEQAIQVTLDGISQIIYNTKVTFSGVSSGKHTLKAELLKSDSSLYTNIEAVAESTFIVNNETYSLPHLYFNVPCANQVYSSSPVKIEFTLNNFAIVPNGQHIRYQVDSEVVIDYYSNQPILLNNICAGKHTLSIWTVDEGGNTISFPYGSGTVEFIVGLNSNALVKLYVENESLYGVSSNVFCYNSITPVDIGNIQMENIYSPVDLQLLPANNSSLLIAKLRSPCWWSGLGDQDMADEFVNRVSYELLVSSNASSSNILAAFEKLTPTLNNVSTKNLIYKNGYLDGHSVIELDSNGNIIYSNNDAKIAESKEIAMKTLGSCEKLEDNELLVGDPYGKRAIITSTNSLSRTSTVQWEYNSDRYVSDFHLVIQDDIILEINDGSISESELFIREGSTIIWKNNSASPISIYSGTTSYDIFYQNPDLNLYGSEYYSSVLQPGETYSHKFNSIGISNWFVYPTILTGKITITSHRVSDRDQYIILENDGLDSPYTSRVIRVDSYGNIVWKFGEGYLVKPRDARPLLNNRVLIST